MMIKYVRIKMDSPKKRILLADPSSQQIQAIMQMPAAKDYLFETAENGSECLDKILSFQPDLVFLELLLPEIHAIEILRKIRSNSTTKTAGVIIASAQPMIQNYHVVIHEGADYFLTKPFEPIFFFSLVQRFFEGALTPAPFSGELSTVADQTSCYVPKMHDPKNFIRFWGSRGSNPVSGAEYVQHGGNTCCLEVHYGKDVVIIDAGTGIRPLGAHLLTSDKKHIHLFLGHTHWDHITGFPFFTPIYDPSFEVSIWGPIGFEKSTKELFTEMFAYAYFPVRLDDIKAKLSFNELKEGATIKIGEIEVSTHYAYHPGATLCFKIRVAGKTIGYATDNELFMGYHGHPDAIGKDHPLLLPHQSQIDFYRHCDLLIHEAQYFPEEYQTKVGWGHSSVSNATVLVKYCDVKEWLVTHHDPSHTDTTLQKKLQMHKDILQECGLKTQVHFAYDGLIIPL